METENSTYERLRKLRSRLHQNPEPSGHETVTIEILKEFIKTYTSLETVDREGWFYAVHHEENAKKSVAFRADMDGIYGEDGTLFHGCGHDGHSSVLAGLCLELDKKRLGKNVYFIFQPAEETGQGGKECSRLLTEKKIDEVYAFHNLPGYPLGTVVLKEGTFACASKGVVLGFQGRQSHAAYPEQGVNPAWILGELIVKIPELLALPDFSGMVLATIIEVKAGDQSFGVSPGDGRLSLTLRAEKQEDLNRFEASLLSFARKRAGEMSAKLTVSYADEFPDTVNKADWVKRCKARLMEQKIPCMEISEPLRWSEDFGWYLKKADGMFFGVGAGEACPGLHTREYEFPDEVMKTALAAMNAFL
ncbi:M20 metallopeptidase family protein [Lacrimispora sp. JR3]|uniref:M20 metallopeptidase family protein n=1 Tax=Lacrimispora sinapis TaxID=3111456 RepID=UPI0037483B53